MFNRQGLEAVFFGPQNYHVDKCKGATMTALTINEADILICHFLELRLRPTCRMAVLSCHEKETFPLATKFVSGYDAIRFVSESQRAWHRYSGRSVVIPDNVGELHAVTPSAESVGVAGIIGTVLPAKQTHVSVARALADGMRLVRIYGTIGDSVYFEQAVQPLLSDRVVYVGHVTDKQAIYDSISCVYHSSVSETYGLVKAECRKAGLPYYGTPECDFAIDVLPEKHLFKLWKQFLQLDE
jgi:hypothetical protein